MGDLKGHAVPGSMFLIFGLWWAVGCLKRFFICHKGNRKYQATATYGCPCACGRLMGRVPVEPIVKIILAALGAFFEITLNMPHPSMGIIQHATMYFFFLMSGVIDLVTSCGVAIPPGADYVAVAMAFAVEGLLFANHLHGRPPVDIQLHMLLVYVVAATVMVILLEARFQHSPVLSMARAFLVMLQGSWFWAAGIILYGHGHIDDGKNAAWDLNDHMQVMQVTIYFTWHCAAHLILLFSLSLLFHCVHRRGNGHMTSSNGHGGIPLTSQGEAGSTDAYKMLQFHDDTDSDLEFERPLEKASLLKSGSNV